MTSLVEHIGAAIARRRLLRDSQSLLVAVSGGLDSMVLLSILHDLAKERRWNLTIAHLNHRLRGRSSDADERLVRSVAKRLGKPAIVERANTRAFARVHRLSLEMAARQLRHEFLAKTASRLRIRTVALAHHADDQVELFFLRLLRGSGGEGLAGMKWQNASPVSRNLQLIRPLLDLSKADLRAYAAEQEIPFREDASNASLDILRNRIRHELLPLLRLEYQPALDRTVLRLMDIVGAEAEFVTQAARECRKKVRSPKSELRRREASSPRSTVQPVLRSSNAKDGSPQPKAVRLGSEFDRLDRALQRACLRLQLVELGVAPNFELIEWLRDKPGQSITVSSGTRGLTLSRTKQGAVEVLQKAVASFRAEQLKLDLRRRRGETIFGGVRLQWLMQIKRGAKRPPGCSGIEYFDADKVGPIILLRHWRPGDRFQPVGMPSAVKLQDWFVNQKVAHAERRRLLMAQAAGGEIFWLEGQRISERFKLTTSTIRRLQWQWERL